jgi:hypothetical protein
LLEQAYKELQARLSHFLLRGQILHHLKNTLNPYRWDQSHADGIFTRRKKISQKKNSADKMNKALCIAFNK